MNWKDLFSLILACTLLCGIALPGAAAEDSLFTEEMVQRSLLSIGNTARIHAAMEKARQGQDVTLVYLGGSITEGASASPQKTHCYAALSAKAFAEKFAADPEKVHYVNAGISGTPSRLGIILELLSQLPQQESRLLTLRYGLEGGLPLSAEDTAKRLGLTPEEVVLREAAALAKLRNNS